MKSEVAVLLLQACEKQVGPKMKAKIRRKPGLHAVFTFNILLGVISRESFHFLIARSLDRWMLASAVHLRLFELFGS